MSVKVTNNTPALIAVRQNKVALAIRLMLEATHQTANPKTPKKYGRLRSDVRKQVQGTSGTIIWDKNYALFQEAGITHGTTMRNYTTAGTGPHFAANAVLKVVRNAHAIFKQVGL